GSSLISGGYTVAGYSENLASVGSLASTAGGTGGYARKHAPWTNWQGTGTNRLPSSVGQPYTNFPTTTSTFSTLPTVSFVIPNLNDDMHNPTIYTNPTTYSVTAISNGDTWVYNNLTNYITWAKTHNSLLILTFDEDDGGVPNKILTMFIGQQVQGGSYSNTINHYSVLRTIEDMYGIARCDSSVQATPITNIWRATTGIEQNNLNNAFVIYPNPSSNSFHIDYTGVNGEAVVNVYDINGKVVLNQEMNGKTIIDVSTLSEGIYNINITNSEGVVNKRVVIAR
ncbi:MAG TPA: alkaline phosphatase family protein, partial [Bacteroidia bacterium]